jgi:hypothetical protein
VAKFLQDHVPRDTKIKGNIEYPMSFTGRDAVVSYRSQSQFTCIQTY